MVDVSTEELVGKLTEHQQELFESLTKLQKGVATHYLRGKSPAEAHKLAGGRCKDEKNRPVLAHEILNNPNVKAFIGSVEKKVIEEAQTSKIMSRQQALERLTKIATTETKDLVQGDTEPTVTQHHQTANMNMTAIKQISDMMGYNREADEDTKALTQEERILNMIQDHAVSKDPLV